LDNFGSTSVINIFQNLGHFYLEIIVL